MTAYFAASTFRRYPGLFGLRVSIFPATVPVLEVMSLPLIGRGPSCPGLASPFPDQAGASLICEVRESPLQ
jgi:hypothetical protein